MRYYQERKYIVLMCILIVIIVCALAYLIQFQLLSKIAQFQFGNQMEQIAKKNETQIFKIRQIVLYSSAHAIDYSQEQNLQDVSISQYTDIAMYIDNTKSSQELTRRKYN